MRIRIDKAQITHGQDKVTLQGVELEVEDLEQLAQVLGCQLDDEDDEGPTRDEILDDLADRIEEVREHVTQVDDNAAENRRELSASITRKLASQALRIDEALNLARGLDPTEALIQRLKRRGGRG